MRKNKIIYIITLTLITISITYGLNINKTTKPIFLETTTKKEMNKYKKISFYNKNNLKRYISYHNKKKNLSVTEIITQVNIGLDNPYYTNIKETNKLNDPLVLVNKYINLPTDYIPNNLKNIDKKYSLPGMQLIDYAAIQFEQMSEDASKNNLKIIAFSTYRSYNYQQNLYNKYIQTDGQKKADTYSARPGHSEHQTALAVDIYNQKVNYTEFESTEEFKWLQQNAHNYGFILRYPKNKTNITGYIYEPWHYRYVGIETATKIHNQNITYDEYYIQNFDT